MEEKVEWLVKTLHWLSRERRMKLRRIRMLEPLGPGPSGPLRLLSFGQVDLPSTAGVRKLQPLGQIEPFGAQPGPLTAYCLRSFLLEQQG